LEAWVIVEPYSGGKTQVVLERNPYFWQVDPDGNQYPYIDRLVGTIYGDPEGLLFGALGGNVDFGFRKFDAPANRPVLAEAADRIGAELYEVTPIGGTSLWFQLNLTHKDPELSSLFNEKDFRVALSTGFDRQEVIDTVLLGDGEPWHAAPFEDSPMYHEGFAKQYLEFDPEGANSLLDGLGLTARDGNDIRTTESGKPVRFATQAATAPAELRDQLEVMAQQWANNIGVRMDINVSERSVQYAMINANDHDAAAWDENSSWLTGRPPVSLIPLTSDARYGIPWAEWYTSGGERGQEPPTHVQERFELYERTRVAANFEEYRELFHQMADIAAEQFETFGVSKFMPTYGLKKTAMRNVWPSNPGTSQYPPALQHPWSFYWATESGNRPVQ
jgi:peptide/nickel transport system substrate-binding protein